MKQKNKKQIQKKKQIIFYCLSPAFFSIDKKGNSLLRSLSLGSFNFDRIFVHNDEKLFNF